jgi:hypothetical protein
VYSVTVGRGPVGFGISTVAAPIAIQWAYAAEEMAAFPICTTIALGLGEVTEVEFVTLAVL